MTGDEGSSKSCTLSSFQALVADGIAEDGLKRDEAEERTLYAKTVALTRIKGNWGLK